MYKYKELLDLSNFRVSSKYCCKDKNVVGTMNDEYSGKPILKFAGQRCTQFQMKVVTKSAQTKVTMHYIEF